MHLFYNLKSCVYIQGIGFPLLVFNEERVLYTTKTMNPKIQGGFLP